MPAAPVICNLACGSTAIPFRQAVRLLSCASAHCLAHVAGPKPAAAACIPPSFLTHTPEQDQVLCGGQGLLGACFLAPSLCYRMCLNRIDGIIAVHAAVQPGISGWPHNDQSHALCSPMAAHLALHHR